MPGTALFLLLYLCVVSLSDGAPNDVERFALKLANCKRDCFTKYADWDTQKYGWCVKNCTLKRACSLESCDLYCDRRDEVCNTTCDSFVDDVTCDTACGSPVEVTVTVSANNTDPGYPHFNVSMGSPPAQTVVALVLLDDDSQNALDYTWQTNATFGGLLPIRGYQIRVLLFFSTSCCTYSDGKTYNPGFNYDDMDKTTYYPYSLTTDWLYKADDNTRVVLNESQYIFPRRIYYYFNHTEMHRMMYTKTDEAFTTKFVLANQRFTKDFSSSPATPPKRIGSGFFVKKVEKSITLYLQDEKSNLNLKIKFKPKKELQRKPVEFCTSIPNRFPKEQPYTLTLECDTKTNGTITTKKFHENIIIYLCFKSNTPDGEVTEPCCSTQGAVCMFKEKDTTRQLNLSLNSSYLLYFVNDVTNTQCGDQLCDGYYQRITPLQDIKCIEPTPTPPDTATTILISVSSCLVGVVVLVVVVVLVWYKSCRETYKPPPLLPPSILGKELNRQDIAKEKYIQRGNFGMIFEGRLKLTATGGDDLSRFQTVAIKLLKPKLEEEELDETENLKDAKKAMSAEINIMKRLQNGREPHINVLMMYGYVIDAAPYILVLELCTSDLKRYLRSLRLTIDNKMMTPADLEANTICAEPGKSATLPATNPTTTSVAKVPVSKTLSRSNQQPDRSLSTYDDSKLGRMTREQPKLDKFKDKVLTTAELLDYCWQVASGMDFIHSLNVIHRDIAADNILITEQGDRQVLKICDFGQSRILFNNLYTISGDNVAERQRKCRLRWSAPEISKDVRNWSKFCDVWSFGVYMWEVYTLGGFPYSGWPERNVLDNIISGMRMEKPDPCSEPVWRIMSRCWSADPDKRLDFETIKDEIEEIKADETDKALGIERSDYVTVDCGPADHDIPLDPDEANAIDITAVDTEQGPLSLQVDTDQGLLGLHTQESNDDSKMLSSFVVVQNTVAIDQIELNSI